jgi:hypothetical protein
VEDLRPTEHHVIFSNQYKGDTKFRNGYWKYVVERFFYIEEFMLQYGVTNCISIEYDVLLYAKMDALVEKLSLGKQTLRFVKDNPVKGHPAFMYIPFPMAMTLFCKFIVEKIDSGLEDMQLLAAYGNAHPTLVSALPVITEERNRSICPRRSFMGHVDENPTYLSEDSEYFEVLFDSLCVGQFLGGIDLRNTGGHKVKDHINIGALYSVAEMPFRWIKIDTKWAPVLDGRPLVCIHVHSKALKNFLSDRLQVPCDDYNVTDIMNQLVQND